MFEYYAKWISKFSDCIQPLIKAKQFLLDAKPCEAFYNLKQLIMKSAQHYPDNTKPYIIECDASDVAVLVILNQLRRSVAFIPQSLNCYETHYPAIEKEATAGIKAVRKWSHFLFGKYFTTVTDQKSVAFMFYNLSRSKIKNGKIQVWCLELANFSYDICYHPECYNIVTNALSHVDCNASFDQSLKKLHDDLCYPGITRLLHYVHSKNMPFSTGEVKEACVAQ